MKAKVYDTVTSILGLLGFVVAVWFVNYMDQFDLWSVGPVMMLLKGLAAVLVSLLPV